MEVRNSYTWVTLGTKTNFSLPRKISMRRLSIQSHSEVSIKVKLTDNKKSTYSSQMCPILVCVLNNPKSLG